MSLNKMSFDGKTRVVEPHRIDPGKRVTALVFDLIAAYFIGIIATMLPFIGKFLTFQVTMIVFWLIKDSLFRGHGIGKNLIGLRVVDMATGDAPTIAQSAIRNSILIAPFAVLEILNVTVPFLHVAWIDNLIMAIFNIAGMLYVAIVLPMEAYRAYSREDSMRKGDELAGTCVVEAPMNFSELFPK
jgi:hypothetical protein